MYFDFFIKSSNSYKLRTKKDSISFSIFRSDTQKMQVSSAFHVKKKFMSFPQKVVQNEKKEAKSFHV